MSNVLCGRRGGVFLLPQAAGLPSIVGAFPCSRFPGSSGGGTHTQFHRAFRVTASPVEPEPRTLPFLPFSRAGLYGPRVPLDPPSLESFMGNILRGCTYSRETQSIQSILYRNSGFTPKSGIVRCCVGGGAGGGRVLLKTITGWGQA